jgi:hypothetical protein
VANKSGGSTRFRSLSVTATADVRDTISYEGQFAKNSAEASPVEFYQRLFGSDFVNPNATSFAPNPRIMAEKSVLSARSVRQSSVGPGMRSGSPTDSCHHVIND